MNLRDAIDKDVFNIDADNYTDADFQAMSIDELETLKMRIDKIISELSIAIKEKQIEYQNGGKGFTRGWYSGHKGYLTINQHVLTYVSYLIKKRRREGRTISDHFMEQAKTFLPRNDFDNILNKALQEMGEGA